MCNVNLTWSWVRVSHSVGIVSTVKTPASPYEYGSFGEFFMAAFGFASVLQNFSPITVLTAHSSFPADNGSTLSSEGVTDSATSTDNNYGYMGTHAHVASVPPLSRTAVRPRSPALDVVPHSFSVCLCSSGQEPFKRRPILNHLHHIAIRIGDTLPQ